MTNSLKLIIGGAVLVAGFLCSLMIGRVAYARWAPDLDQIEKNNLNSYFQAVNKKTDAYKLTQNGARLIGNNDFQFAEINLKKALEIDPNYRDALVCLGYAQVKSGQTTEALVTLKKAAEIDPINAKTYEILELAYLQNNDQDSAAKAHEKFEFLSKK